MKSSSEILENATRAGGETPAISHLAQYIIRGLLDAGVSRDEIVRCCDYQHTRAKDCCRLVFTGEIDPAIANPRKHLHRVVVDGADKWATNNELYLLMAYALARILTPEGYIEHSNPNVLGIAISGVYKAESSNYTHDHKLYLPVKNIVGINNFHHGEVNNMHATRILFNNSDVSLTGFVNSDFARYESSFRIKIEKIVRLITSPV